MEIVLYEDKPKRHWWTKLGVYATPALCLIAGLLIYFLGEPAESEENPRIVGIAFFALVLLSLLASLALTVRKYQILEDRIKIVRGKFSESIPFKAIKKVGMGGAFDWKRKRFTTSKERIMIQSGRMKVHRISPERPELFLEELNKAIANWKRSQGIT